MMRRPVFGRPSCLLHTDTMIGYRSGFCAKESTMLAFFLLCFARLILGLMLSLGLAFSGYFAAWFLWFPSWGQDSLIPTLAAGIGVGGWDCSLRRVVSKRRWPATPTLVVCPGDIRRFRGGMGGSSPRLGRCEGAYTFRASLISSTTCMG